MRQKSQGVLRDWRGFAIVMAMMISASADASVALVNAGVDSSASTNLIKRAVKVDKPTQEYRAAWLIDLDRPGMDNPAQSISFNLPDGTSAVVERRHWDPRSHPASTDENPSIIASERGAPSWRWYGVSRGYTVALTMVSGVLAGRIVGPSGIHYAILPTPSGTLLGITNSDFWHTHPDGWDAPPDSTTQSMPDAKSLTSLATTWDYSCSGAVPGGSHVLDVLALYTPGILAAYGSVTAVTAVIQSALDDANQSLSNSGINTFSFFLNRVEAADSSHNYDGETIGLALDDVSGITSLTTTPWCSYPGNSYIATRRSATGSDIVALARRDATVPLEGSCGVSRAQRVVVNGSYYLGSSNCPRDVGAGYVPYAYMVFDPGCNADRLNMAHEMGHLVGMEHDPRNANSLSSNSTTGNQPSCPWSFGNKRSSGATRFHFRDVMSYWSSGTGVGGGPLTCGSDSNCPQIDAYTNPSLEWDGPDDGVNTPPFGIQPVGTLSGAYPIGVATAAGPSPAARANDTLPRLAPIVEAFYPRPDLIFADGFQ